MPNVANIVMWAVIVYLALDALNVVVFGSKIPIPSLINFAMGKKGNDNTVV